VTEHSFSRALTTILAVRQNVHNGGDARPRRSSRRARGVSWERDGVRHGRGRPQLLADAPVDALAEQIGVPVMARVLLDHVHHQLAQRDRLTLGVAAREAEIVVTGELLREGDLLTPRRPRLSHDSRISDRPVEVGVGSASVSSSASAVVLAAVLVSALLTLSLFALTYVLERIAIPWYRLSRQSGRER